jgi:DNA-binding PadR family transcriptional regulator
MALELKPESQCWDVHLTLFQRCGRSVHLSSLYKTLHRLSAKGMVEAGATAPERISGGRRRTCWSCTAAGRETVAGVRQAIDWLASPCLPRERRLDSPRLPREKPACPAPPTWSRAPSTS